MHFLNIKACKHIFGVRQNKTMNLKMSIYMHSLMFMVVYSLSILNERESVLYCAWTTSMSIDFVSQM